MTEQYGERGFVPTVENVKREGNALVMETIDSREETDLVSLPGEPIKRKGDLVTDEQQEQLALWERNT